MARVFLITRDQESSLITQEQIKASNLSSVIYPLFKVRPIEADLRGLKAGSEIIITSKNALTFKDLDFWRKLNKQHKFLIIGNNFSSYLELSLIHNYQIFQNSSVLYDYLELNDKQYFYLRGEVISFDISSRVKNLIETICYGIDYFYIDRANIKSFIQKESVSDLIFLSKENAQNFLHIMGKDELQNYNIYCLSKRIAEVFSDFQSKLFYPESSNFAELVKLMK